MQTPRCLALVPTSALASAGSWQAGGAQSAPRVVPVPSWQSTSGARVCTGWLLTSLCASQGGL